MAEYGFLDPDERIVSVCINGIGDAANYGSKALKYIQACYHRVDTFIR